MPDPQPIDGDNPYEKLGLDRTKSKSDIIAEAKKIKNKKQIQVKKRHANDHPDYKQTARELSELKDAITELEKNHPEDGHPEPVDLSLSLVSDDPAVKEPATFRVTGDSGPVQGISVSVEKGQTGTTDSNGEVTFTFDDADSFKLKVSGEFHHRSDTLNVSISPKTISLKIATAPDELEAREDGRIRVTDQEGNGIQSVPLLSEDGQIARTDSSGVATVAFDTPDTYEIEATASDTDDIRYTSDTTTIDVVPTQIPLTLQVPKGGLKTNEQITFRVVDDQQTGVKGATVRVKEGSKGTTNSDGETKLEFSKPGPRTLSVDKTVSDDSVEYQGDTVTIEVGKGTSSLQIVETGGEFSENETARVKVADSNGFDIEGAKITTDQGHKKTTDKNGWAEIEIKSGGELSVKATKDSERLDYEPVERTYSIDEYKPSIEFEGFPNIVSQNESLRVRVIDDNENGVKGARIHSTQQRQQVWTTDSDGYVQIQAMDSVGAEQFTADKPETEFEEIAKQRVVVQ